MKTQRFRTAEIQTRAESDSPVWPVTISTDTPLDRGGWLEALSHANDAIDLSRAPLPVIESHDRGRVNIGTVEGLKSDGHKLRGMLRLGASTRATELAADIDAGIVTGISVGYQVLAHEEDEDGNVLVTRWMPFEISIVAVPADIGAGINRSMSMPKPNPPSAPERRESQILELCERAKLDLSFARSLIDDEALDLEGARAKVIDELATRDSPRTPSTSLVNERLMDFRAAAVDAILVRSGIPVKEPHAAMQDVRGMSIKEMARTILTNGGIRVTGMSDAELFKRSLATSDFPAILVDAANKALRMGMEAEASSHRQWVKVTPANDFKTMHRPILGNAPDLLPVGEYGEYTHAGPMEDDEGFAVAKYGRAMRFSWEAFVNDDLSAFTTIPRAFAMAAQRKEADQVYAVFTANSGGGQTMNDATDLFHADHGNLASSSAALDADALDAGRALMRKQRSVAADDGSAGYLNLSPRYLIVAPDHEGAAERLIASSTIIKTSTMEASNQWISRLVPVVEARLDGSAAYLAADSGVIDTVELAVLDGHPVVEEDMEFLVDARSYKCRHVFGSRCLDWRGLVKIPISGG